jgi:hypothetical protein
MSADLMVLMMFRFVVSDRAAIMSGIGPDKRTKTPGPRRQTLSAGSL